MNSNIKGTMGCSSNTNTSKSLLKMAKGTNRRITMFDNESHRALQTTSLASKLIVKDTILKQCLHICNQNFDKRKYYKCVQCSEDDWMVWNFHYDPSSIQDNIDDMVPKFLNVFHVCLKRLLGIPFLRCDCLFYDRWLHMYLWVRLYIQIHLNMLFSLIVVDCHVSMYSR